ncbi:MAG: hypothetical protein DWC07_04755 [Candidatus Poseidoniales archaeon]|nr:MAG: hypothetical protein DWC07_04755 [Candidatus Poseidoniales archaeon]
MASFDLLGRAAQEHLIQAAGSVLYDVLEACIGAPASRLDLGSCAARIGGGFKKPKTILTS